MAFLRLAFFPSGTAEQWARVVDAVGDVDPPPGRRVFAAGPVDGGWQVVQLSDSRQDLEQFNAEVFLPAMSALAGGGFPQPPVVRDVETASAWVGPDPLP